LQDSFHKQKSWFAKSFFSKRFGRSSFGVFNFGGFVFGKVPSPKIEFRVKFSQVGCGSDFQLAGLAQSSSCQQSVQRIFGSLRDLQAFFWLRVFFLHLKQNLSPPKIR